MNPWTLALIWLAVCAVALVAVGLIEAARDKRAAKRDRAPRELTGSDYPTRDGWFAQQYEVDDETRDAS